MNDFSPEEVQAMRERAHELRAFKGGSKKAKQLEALMDVAQALDEHERNLVLTVHHLVSEIAPDLNGRTWYGMPAWEKDGEVVVFVQHASKFGTRYSTLGFTDAATLDDGAMWPASFAITQLSDEVRERIRALVTRATA